MVKKLNDVIGAAISISSDEQNAIILVNRGEKREKIVVKGDDFENSELTRDEYILELEKLPKPYLFMRGKPRE